MLLLIQYTLIFSSVLTLVALGGCISEHSGVINLGLEGIMVIGALGGALVMSNMTALPGPLLVILSILAAVVFGMLYSCLLGVACIYLVLVMIFSALVGILERRLRQSDRR